MSFSADSVHPAKSASSTDVIMNPTIAVAIALGLSVAAYFTLTFVFDPLRSVPGPLIARFSGLWLIVLEFAGQRSTVLHRLHQRHGPVIRIAPSQLSFSSTQALRDIYGPRSKYSKAPAYGAFGRKSLFTMRSKEEHRGRSKRIGHIFAPISVQSIEPILYPLVGKLMSSLEKRVEEPVDVIHWFRMLALDVIGEIFLGKNYGGLEMEVAPPIMQDIDDVFPSYWFKYQFPWLQKVLAYAPFKPIQHFATAGDRFYEYGADAFHDYVARYGRTGDRRDLLTKMIAESKSTSTSTTTSQPLTDDEIINEITNLTFAGIDTTGNTFSYLFWELARNPQWQVRLREELKDISFPDGVPQYKDVANLPVLEALIQETLRIHPAAPASLPRIAPKEGGTIDGTTVPGNTIISCQAYTTQRDPTIYPDPDAFLPERWLNQGDDTADAMREMILVWGKGTRACLGKPIATMELKLATAALVRKFSVEIGSPITDDDMEMTDHFTLIPKGGKCLLTFRNVEVEKKKK